MEVEVDGGSNSGSAEVVRNALPEMALVHQDRAAGMLERLDRRTVVLDPPGVSLRREALCLCSLRDPRHADEQAIDAYNGALSASPDYASAYAQRADAYSSLGDNAKAAADPAKLFETKNDDPRELQM